MDLFVFESPWDVGQRDNGRNSVVPYFRALEQCNSRIKLYSRIFYDANSLRYAIDELFINPQNPIVYVASHGSNARIGTPDGWSDVNLDTFFEKLQRKNVKLGGIILGCCNAGGNQDILKYLDEHQIDSRFVFGYNCSVEWDLSTLIDMSLIREIARHNINMNLKNILVNVLEKFCFDYEIDDGRDDDGAPARAPVVLKDAFVLCEQQNDAWVNISQYVVKSLKW